MTSSRRGQQQHHHHHPTTLSVPMPSSATVADAPVDLPPIDALFLIDFDVKAGYTIAWKRAADGVELDGRVEYKSLPSGLHTVSEDLIYFVHDGLHAGLSAFVNMPCDEEDARNARMIAVGVLVPLSYGRLGRAWRHAQGLKDMATILATDRKQTDLLDKYWEEHRAKKNASQPPTSGETPVTTPAVTFSEATAPQPRKGPNRNRSASDGASLAPTEHKLSPHHPAWRLTSLLDKFGPLLFPIHRAALLRQRILISCHAPVHETCDFVYNLSILSNIPLSLNNILPENTPTQRLRPLFTIGVHDIPFLMEDYEASKRRGLLDEAIDDEAGSGWIACTTDSILAMKDTLWDMLITMPPEHSAHAKDKVWPTIECPRGTPVKATQRDVRRFNALRNGLARLAQGPGTPSADETPQHHPPNADDSFDQVAEPLTWAAFAYNGYMWWASAGEQLRSEEQEEASRDAALLADLAPAPRAPPAAVSLSDSLASLMFRRGADEASVELAVIAYFHRLTAQMLSVLSDVADGAEEGEPFPSSDEEDSQLLPGAGSNDDDGRAVATVDSRSVENMGLDVWSASDAAFVDLLMRTYFGRGARIEGKGVEVCGVRVC